MIIECPHCYTQVIPKPDDSCPACQKNTKDLRGTDPTRTSLQISEGKILPGTCCGCGGETDRYVTVRRTVKEEGQPGGLAQILIGLLVSLPVALYFFLRGIQNAKSVKVRMPQCAECGRDGPPEPDYVDFGNVTMTFIVHRKLRDLA